eukprot:GILJ01032947.1.p1 GENE.GILJ01032947.1~~GILJ01032947.1.p1  ORF type:complete len:288 (+),score=5.78 GILJ01032947.1:33-866(+)
MTQLVINADIARLRVGVDHNEAFAVTPNHKLPYEALWAIGLLPLVASIFVCHYFLNHTGDPIFVGQGSAVLQSLSDARSKFIILCCAFCLSCILTLRLMSAFAMVCNYPTHEMNNLCSFSHDIMDIFRAKYGPNSLWLTNGTLIGALRGDRSLNYMITNDHDFDTCYDRKLEPEVLATVRGLGATYERFSRTYNELDNHIRVYPPSFSLLSGHSGPLMYELQACDPPQEVTMITGCNNHPVPIPSNYNEYLTSEFGADWPIPLAVNHGFLCKILKTW